MKMSKHKLTTNSDDESKYDYMSLRSGSIRKRRRIGDDEPVIGEIANHLTIKPKQAVQSDLHDRTFETDGTFETEPIRQIAQQTWSFEAHNMLSSFQNQIQTPIRKNAEKSSSAATPPVVAPIADVASSISSSENVLLPIANEIRPSPVQFKTHESDGQSGCLTLLILLSYLLLLYLLSFLRVSESTESISKPADLNDGNLMTNTPIIDLKLTSFPHMERTTLPFIDLVVPPLNVQHAGPLFDARPVQDTADQVQASIRAKAVPIDDSAKRVGDVQKREAALIAGVEDEYWSQIGDLIFDFQRVDVDN